MVIRTVERSYRVIRTLEGSREITAFLCDSENGDPFLLIRPKGQALSRNMLRCFLEQRNKGNAGKPEDCFVREGVVWAAFAYGGGTPICEWLKEGRPYRLRAALGRELAEQIFTRNLPVYLQYEALHPSNLMVSKERGLCANFLFFEPEKFSKDLLPEVEKRFADCLSLLYAEELEDGKAEELSDFLRKLKSAEFTDGTGIYRAYRKVCGELTEEPYKEGEKKKGILPILWAKATEHGKHLFFFFYWLLVLLLWAGFVYACVTPQETPQERIRFQNIGELPIDGFDPVYVPAEETEEPIREEFILPAEETEEEPFLKELPETETIGPEMGGLGIGRERDG